MSVRRSGLSLSQVSRGGSVIVTKVSEEVGGSAAVMTVSGRKSCSHHERWSVAVMSIGWGSWWLS